ncbi:hypothetical protein GEV33_014176 [Tenebrio molitor]|uniref:Ig-like domain-containing protein n=1 Tax=Tenebrio molitor TaxID=7067 RepID=A0A8J6GYT0_TENMO|nr:hypothetical protein GEV33_014176 [Tenebrio molitor]
MEWNSVKAQVPIARVVYSKEDPYFSESPKNVDVVQGKSVTLPCKVTPGMGMTYYWELNGSKIANTTRRYQQGSNLHITRVDRERDSGQFTCIAEDSTSSLAGSITSSGASLNIQFSIDKKKSMHRPGIEPGPPAWQASILPLNHRCYTYRGAARPLQSNGSNLLTEPEVESPKRNQKSTIFCLKGTVVHFVEYLVDAASESTRFSSARHIPPTTVPDKWLCR